MFGGVREWSVRGVRGEGVGRVSGGEGLKGVPTPPSPQVNNIKKPYLLCQEKENKILTHVLNEHERDEFHDHVESSLSISKKDSNVTKLTVFYFLTPSCCGF